VGQPNILFVMTDQQRVDTIAALGNRHIYTPNLDRLVRRGLTFENAYSTCPVCLPARYTIRTGCEPPTTGAFANHLPGPVAPRCGPYLAQRMRSLGYRTFGIGKFHTRPWDEDLGYDVYLHSEELYGSPQQRAKDDYAAWITRQHPTFAFIETLMGERTEMYYMPQMSPLPAELTVERWAADRAVEQLQRKSRQPYFGFVSFIGPHPPFAPPIPFNRMYDPDRLPNPKPGNLATDHMDDQIPWMNHLIWADNIHADHARVLKARYYGEISYIDDCLGRILDAVDARPDADNTLICFFSDHGDLLGDHHGWQKECFFEASCRVPFLLSWPARLPANRRCDELVCLTDLFGLATHAAGTPDPREGHDLLATLAGDIAPRAVLTGFHGNPGTPNFKLMIRLGAWKYIFMANGGREQLFNVRTDPDELTNRLKTAPTVANRLRQLARAAGCTPGARPAVQRDGQLRSFRFRERQRKRVHQFDTSRGVSGFPTRPADALQIFQKNKKGKLNESR